MQVKFIITKPSPRSQLFGPGTSTIFSDIGNFSPYRYLVGRARSSYVLRLNPKWRCAGNLIAKIGDIYIQFFLYTKNYISTFIKITITVEVPFQYGYKNQA